MITPEILARNGSEDSEQAAIFCWAQQNLHLYPQLKWMFAVPNGGYRDKRTAGKLKATGVKAGVPDIWLPVSKKEVWGASLGKITFGLIIELKIRTKRRTDPLAGTSDEQKEWLEQLRQQGYAVHVCYGWEDARDRIVKYLKQ